ncbi:MAG: flippase-like domain-containing protein [Sedimentisphaerales bacterium]|nr:flippase-like domain-containing protein [Sedimentisphaerales bacterium]
MKHKIKTFLWTAVAILALGFLVYSTPKETFRQTIRQVSWYCVLTAVLLYFVAQTLLASRWVLLLRVQGIYISQFQAIRLTYMGLFYNNFMPGAVGGDLLKGWYITHHSEKHLRVEAAVTVFVDRLIGLIGMILVAGIASLFISPELGPQMDSGQRLQIRWLVWLIFLAMVAGSTIFLSRHVRRVLMISHILQKLPFEKALRQIDDAIRIYRHHKQVVLISLLLTALIQGLSIVAIWLLTRSLHLEKVTFVQCLIIMPVIWVISAAIPVPGGIGIIENCVKYLFCLVINPDAPGRAIGQAVALALLIRIMICLCSLPGALVPIFGGHLPKRSELAKQISEKKNV